MSNKSTIYTCQYFKWFRSSYFSHLHLHKRVHFNFALTHLHREQVLVQVHFTSSCNTSLARGSEIHMGSSLPSSSFHPWLVGLLTGIMDIWAVVQMLAWKTLLLRCRCEASLVGGILSTSLVFCENTLNRTTSTSLSSFDSLEYNLQTKFIATSISLGDIWNGVSTIVAHSYIRDGTSCINLQQYRLPLNLKEDVLSDPVNAWKRAMALHVVVPRFVAIVFNEIILVVFRALKEIQISAAGFRALM